MGGNKTVRRASTPRADNIGQSGRVREILRKLEGKVVRVTGGASGIGEAAARLFVDQGTGAVVIGDIQTEKGRSVAESIGLHRCSYVHCDVTDEEQVKKMVDFTVATYGRLDVMFSNAGILTTSTQTVLDLDLSVFDRVVSVNAGGMAACVKHAARKMVELGIRGSIVCTASAAAEMGMLANTDYVMSKHAVLGLIRCASQQLGVHGIRVNGVSPSVVLTPLSAAAGFSTVADVENIFRPLKSLKGVVLTPEMVAEAALFLASDQSAFITGKNLMVDGGLIGMSLY